MKSLNYLLHTRFEFAKAGFQKGVGRTGLALCFAGIISMFLELPVLIWFISKFGLAENPPKWFEAWTGVTLVLIAVGSHIGIWGMTIKRPTQAET